MNITLKTTVFFLFILLNHAIFAQVVISEINYNSENSIEAGDWVELYNTSNAPISLNGWTMKDNSDINIFTFGATTLAAGARLVLVNDAAAFAAQHPSVSPAGTFGFGLGNVSDAVRLFNSSGATISAVTYIDSLPWPRGADGLGRTLELLNPTGNLNDPANWFDGCMGGSPGQAYSPCADILVFSEINYNSDSLFDTDDWIELQNTSSSPINIGGWVLYDKVDTNDYVIPAGTTVPANGRLVLAQTLDKFRCFHLNTSNVIGSFGFNLSGDGEVIRLFDNTGKIRFSVVYDDPPTTGWPASPDGEGATLELLSLSGKFNNGDNWFGGCTGGSPGIAYNAACPTPASVHNPIDGTLNACRLQAQTYSVPNVAGVNYAWTVSPNGTIMSGNGTNTITVLWNSAGVGTVDVVQTAP
jgi:hypothetical protein